MPNILTGFTARSRHLYALQHSGKDFCMQVTSRIMTETPVVQQSLRPQRRKMKRAGTIVLFLLPCLVLYFVFIFFPVIQAIYYSLYRWSGLGPLTDFVGLANYTTAFKNATFLAAFFHNLEI